MNDDLIKRLRDAVSDVMQFQFSHSRTGMRALQEVIDAAEAGADEIEQLRAAAVMARTALSDLIASGDPKVYSDALNALDAALRD
jgi:hypothetical protein